MEEGDGGKGLEHQQKFSLGSHTAAVGVQPGSFWIRKGGQPISSWARAAGPLSHTKETPALFIYCLRDWTEWCHKHVALLIKQLPIGGMCAMQEYRRCRCKHWPPWCRFKIWSEHLNFLSTTSEKRVIFRSDCKHIQTAFVVGASGHFSPRLSHAPLRRQRMWKGLMFRTGASVNWICFLLFVRAHCSNEWEHGLGSSLRVLTTGWKSKGRQSGACHWLTAVLWLY